MRRTLRAGERGRHGDRRPRGQSSRAAGARCHDGHRGHRKRGPPVTRAFPYRRPPHDVVRAEIWAMDLADGSIPLPDVLPDWDYSTHLSLSRSVVVDGVRARTLA